MEEISSEVTFISEWQGDLSLNLSLAKGPKDGRDNMSPWRGFSLVLGVNETLPTDLFSMHSKSWLPHEEINADLLG
jgi:hypothetical protein